MADRIVVRGAREHNLEDVNLEIPRDRLVVFTGLSGSGKSSLAFDTIYAEGQRRYVESLSAYARQFLGQMDKPDVDFIEGLSPAISIDQKSASRNPRSTVGTVTEVYDYLRLLFARIGRPHCPSCGKEVGRQTPQQIVDHVLELGDDDPTPRPRPRRAGPQGRVPRAARRPRSPGLLARPRRRRRPRAHRPRDARPRPLRAAHDRGRRRPARRARGDPPAPHRVRRDRAATRGRVRGGRGPRRGRHRDLRARCSASSSRARTAGSPSTSRPRATSRSTRPMGRARRAPASARATRSTRSSSCPTRPCRSPTARSHRGPVRARATSAGCSPAPRTSAASRSTRRGASCARRTASCCSTAPAARRCSSATSNRYGRLRSYQAELRGRHHLARASARRGRLGLEPRADRGVHARGRVLGLRWRAPQALLARRHRARPLDRRRLQPVDRRIRRVLLDIELTEREAIIGERVIKEILERSQFLVDVGLEYLSLSRSSATLSGGEAQRIRLASQIGSRLVGVLYVLDEPSIGLHQRDNQRLIGDPRAAPQHRQHGHRRRARRRDDPRRRTTWSTSAQEPASTAAPSCTRAR